MKSKQYTRLLQKPSSTFFLLGPRGTGKSTWLINTFPGAHRIDLLRSSEYLSLKRDPSLLRAQVLALPANSWVIIDEIQKLPILLDEVHALIFDTNHQYKFALSGSSARKLKKHHANMLAGRALAKKFFPLTSLELLADFDVNRALRFGQLPVIWMLNTDVERMEFIDSYVENYLREEVQQEALVRGLDSFYRFLGVAAIANGQILNISNIARDVGIARSTIQGYFEILIDTLLGSMLPAFRPRAKVKEIAHPKFYFFDCGIVRALKHELRSEPSHEDAGHLFETFFINEVRALNSYYSLGLELFYWRAEHGAEVDLIVVRNKKRIGFEIKHTTTWNKTNNKALQSLLDEKIIEKGFGVYKGDKKLIFDGVEVLPFQEALVFLKSI